MLITKDPSQPPVTPRPAATVLLLRDAPSGGGFQVLMVRRSESARFMPGAYVFPGGAVDRSDMSEAMRARCRGLTPEEAAARIGGMMDGPTAFGHLVAGARESFEEAGVLLAVSEDGGPAAPEPEAVARARERAAAASRDAPFDFAGWLAEQRLLLDLERLEMLARWVTPEVEARRFDTVFLVARVAGDQGADHDRGETIASSWMTPEEALRGHREGRIVLPPPTLRNLEDIAPFGSAEEVLAFARGRPRRIVLPRLVEIEGTWTLLLPGDPLYPSETPVEGATRIVLYEGRWWTRRAT